MKEAKVLFIFITILIDAIGIGIVIPVLPEIMRRFSHSEKEVSEYFGYFISLYALMQLLVSPMLGALSDRYGRRVILLVSLLVAAIDYVVMAYAPTLLILFIGRIIAGLTGANYTVAMAYIADVSTDENRSRNFGFMGAAFGVGFVIGPALGGLLGDFGGHYPFLMAAFLCFLNFLFGLFVLPESLAIEHRRKIELKKVNPLYSVKKLFELKSIMLLLIVHFLFQMSWQTHGPIWTLYTELRFGWGPKEVGLSLGLVGLMNIIGQGFLTGKIIPRVGEYNAIKWGALGYALTFICFAIANEPWMFYVIIISGVVFMAATPSLQSLITKSVSMNEQGELQGSLVSLTSFAAIITPLLVTKLFSTFSVPDAPVRIIGAPYYFAAIACFTAFVLIIKNQKK